MTVSRDHYYRLASDSESERIQAAVALIEELSAADDAEEWEYALKRLIKGLSSSRGSSRLGFSTCLTEIVNIRISSGNLTVERVVELINEHNKAGSSKNGRDERAALFGKLFGIQCLSNANSGIFSADKTDSVDFKLVVDNLVELSCSKSWIREPSLFTLFGMLKSLYAKLSEELVAYVFLKLDEAQLSLTTEGLAIYLAVPSTFRSSVLSSLSFKNNTWKDADPLRKSNISLLSKVLKDISTGEDESAEESASKNSKKKGTWSPRLHFVWQLIVQELTSINAEEAVEDETSSMNSKKRKKSSEKKSKKSKKSNDQSISTSDMIHIPEFWKVIIDESFFSEKSSHERKYWGFEIFELFFQSTSTDLIESLFTKNFLRTLINQSSDNNRMLNKISKKTLSSILKITKAQPLKTVPTLESLLIGPNGNLYFDRLTKSKTVETLVTNDAPSKPLAKLFTKILDQPELAAKEDSLDKETIKKVQKWSLDQLLHLVRAKKSTLENSNDLEWIDSILKNLVKLAYFKSSTDDDNEGMKDEDEVEDSENEEKENIASFAQERLNSILSDVISIERTDNQTWSNKTLSFLLAFIEKGFTPIFQLDEELEIVKQKSLRTLKKIRSKRETHHHKSSKLLVFELLFSMVILQLFSGDAESVNTLQELQDYYHENKSSTEESSTDEQNHIIGIVEILLNFSSQKSSLLKKLSMIIWENCCNQVNLEGLNLLFDVINTKENKEGQRALFEGEDEFVEEGEDEDEDEEHDHDHEGEEDQDEDDESEESEENSDDDEEDDDDESEREAESNDKVAEVEKKTSAAIAEALKIPHNGEVVFSSDDEDDDLSDESMDDEQMMAIDGQLSKIFQQRREALNQVQTGNKRKQEKEDAKENIILFKHRIVDLLDVFARKNPNSELIVFTVTPLLNALKITLDKNLGTKIHKLLKNRICKSKIDLETVTKEELFELLNLIHKDVLRTSNTNDYNLSCSQCSIFISKQIIQLDESLIDQVIDIYAELLKHWWKKKNARLTSSIFFDFINWLNSKRTSGAATK